MLFVCSLSTLWRTVLSSLFLLFIVGAFVPSAPAADSLTIYSGRSERLIKPVLDAFTATTGILKGIVRRRISSLPMTPAAWNWPEQPGSFAR